MIALALNVLGNCNFHTWDSVHNIPFIFIFLKNTCFPNIILLFTAMKKALNHFWDSGYLVTHPTFLSVDGF